MTPLTYSIRILYDCFILTSPALQAFTLIEPATPRCSAPYTHGPPPLAIAANQTALQDEDFLPVILSDQDKAACAGYSA
jgi:hypothetical protein